MKRFFKQIVLFFLRRLSQARIRRMKGVKIIGITGSLGKTSTKDAVTHLLSMQFSVLSSQKSFNSELGLPMTILEIPSLTSMLEWPRRLVKAFFCAYFSRKKYDYLVLELGVDKPGDMDDHMAIVRPDIAVFTSIAPVHMAKGQFKNLAEIAEEKGKLVLATKKEGMAFLNFDNDMVKKFSCEKDVKAETISYGIHGEPDLCATGIMQEDSGVSFVFESKKIHTEHMRFFVPVIGVHHIAVVLPAIGIALLQGMKITDIAERMRSFQLPPGRMNLIKGLRDSVLIDSSYNASPIATEKTFEAFLEFCAGRAQRKFFVFGNMNELGEMADASHRKVGELAAEANIDFFIAVGDFAKLAADQALSRGLPKERVVSFSHPVEAAQWLENMLRAGDYVLIKGSQNNVRLEKLIQHVMKDPHLASELLVRQDGYWKRH